MTGGNTNNTTRRGTGSQTARMPAQHNTIARTPRQRQHGPPNNKTPKATARGGLGGTPHGAPRQGTARHRGARPADATQHGRGAAQSRAKEGKGKRANTHHTTTRDHKGVHTTPRTTAGAEEGGGGHKRRAHQGRQRRTAERRGKQRVPRSSTAQSRTEATHSSAPATAHARHNNNTSGHTVTRSRGGPGHGTLRWTRASEQAGKALRSQGHQCAHVM